MEGFGRWPWCNNIPQLDQKNALVRFCRLLEHNGLANASIEIPEGPFEWVYGPSEEVIEGEPRDVQMFRDYISEWQEGVRGGRQH
jgi:hypothetical protein